MGTRSNVRIFDEDGKILVTLYQQFDGYPSGMGMALYTFLEDSVLVNGIPGGNEHYINGAGDLATQIIAFLKTDIRTKEIVTGNLYVYPPKHKPGNAGEEYLYDVKIEDDSIVLYGYKINYKTLRKQLIFKGKISELSEKIICRE